MKSYLKTLLLHQKEKDIAERKASLLNRFELPDGKQSLYSPYMSNRQGLQQHTEQSQRQTRGKTLCRLIVS
jgi:hypothetical protein